MTTPASLETAVVVLNWNGWRDTLACLASLAGLDGPAPLVIVVDNGSTDESVERIRSAFPLAIVLETRRNLGFAGGCNVGIRYALDIGTPFIWLLNNDTVVEPSALAEMIATAERGDGVGIVGSVVKAFAPSDAVEAWGGGTVNPYLGTTRRWAASRAGSLDYIAGTSMLIRHEVFDRVGLLEQDYFFYMEDVDFSRRAVAAGWTLAVAPGSVVLHRGGATVNNGAATRSEAADRHHVRSSGVFIGRHAGGWAMPAAAIRLAGIALRRIARGRVHALPGLTRAFAAGVVSGVRGRRPA